MSIAELGAFNWTSRILADEEPLGILPPSLSLLSGSDLSGKLEQTCLLEGLDPEQRMQVEGQLADPHTRNKALSRFRDSWNESHKGHLSWLKWSRNPDVLLALFRGLDDKDAKVLAEGGIKVKAGRFSLVDRGKFAEWQAQWVTDFYTYHKCCCMAIAQFGSPLAIRHIPKSSVCLNRGACKQALESEAMIEGSDHLESLIDWIFASETSLGYWLRFAAALYVSTSAVESQTAKIAERQELDLRPIRLVLGDAEGDFEARIPIDRISSDRRDGYQFGYARGQCDLHERVLGYLLDGTLVAGKAIERNGATHGPLAETGEFRRIESRESEPKSLRKLNAIARVFGKAPFASHSEATRAFSVSFLSRQSKKKLILALGGPSNGIPTRQTKSELVAKLRNTIKTIIDEVR